MGDRQDERKFHELAETILASASAPDRLQVCPICGGKLVIRYEIYRRAGMMLGLILECEGCGTGLAIDRGEPLPKWAKP